MTDVAIDSHFLPNDIATFIAKIVIKSTNARMLHVVWNLTYVKKKFYKPDTCARPFYRRCLASFDTPVHAQEARNFNWEFRFKRTPIYTATCP
jgi:hypothetical protein